MNKVVFITGSSSGIGRATAKCSQFHGWDVVATMRNPDKETELMKLSNVTCPKVDVTDSKSIKKAIEETIAHYGKIDVIVNNAGYGLVGPFEAASMEDIRQQFEVNVFGVINVMKEIIPHFRKARSGTIINVTSVGGRVTFPLYSLYHSTKFALEGLSEGIQYELRQFRVKVKMVEPGPVKTDFYGRSLKKVEMKEYNHYARKTEGINGVADELGSNPDDIAKVIYNAATDNSFKQRYVAGFLASLMLFGKRYLPDWLYTLIIRSQSEF